MNLHLTDEQASLVTIRLALMIEEDEKNLNSTKQNPYWRKELDACKALLRELKDFPYGERKAS